MKINFLIFLIIGFSLCFNALGFEVIDSYRIDFGTINRQYFESTKHLPVKESGSVPSIKLGMAVNLRTNIIEVSPLRLDLAIEHSNGDVSYSGYKTFNSFDIKPHIQVNSWKRSGVEAKLNLPVFEDHQWDIKILTGLRSIYDYRNLQQYVETTRKNHFLFGNSVEFKINKNLKFQGHWLASDSFYHQMMVSELNFKDDGMKSKSNELGVGLLYSPLGNKYLVGLNIAYVKEKDSFGKIINDLYFPGSMSRIINLKFSWIFIDK